MWWGVIQPAFRAHGVSPHTGPKPGANGLQHIYKLTIGANLAPRARGRAHSCPACIWLAPSHAWYRSQMLPLCRLPPMLAPIGTNSCPCSHQLAPLLAPARTFARTRPRLFSHLCSHQLTPFLAPAGALSCSFARTRWHPCLRLCSHPLAPLLAPFLAPAHAFSRTLWRPADT